MAQSKLQITVGAVSFSGEGEHDWLAEQLEKVLKVAPDIVGNQPQAVSASPAESGGMSPGSFQTPLATYIREKGGEGNQVERFLITADWLRRRGLAKLTTAAVSKALIDNHQKRLANPADSLNKNVGKGYCEKAEGGFYITPDGLKQLGHK